MSTPMLAELVRGAALRGAAPHPLSALLCTRAGRAFGTLARQRLGGAGKRIAVGRTHEGHQLAIRDGLVRGLVLSGHTVIDVGACSAEQFAFALVHTGADGGVLVATSEGAVHTLSFSLGGKPVSGEGLAALCGLGDDGELAIGSGSLEVVDVRAAWAASDKTLEKGPE